MGTWGTGPFDNDTAADFAGDLDDAPPGEREALVRGVLARTVSAAGYLDEAQEAVAAAALIAAQCPGGRPVETVYGPEQPLPVFPEDLRELAARALDRVLAGGPGLEMWVGPARRAPVAGSGRGCAGCTRSSAAFARCPVAWSLCPGGSGPSCLPPTVRRDRNRPQSGRIRANKTSDPAANCGQNTYERSHPAVDLTTSPP